jgi:hypothetical protein
MMATHVNLMSERAQFSAAARRVALGWALALAATVLGLLPLGAYAWQHRRSTVVEQETLEAQYEPIRQLSNDIRRLRAEAEALVFAERTTLELARDRPTATLLALVSAATADSQGELFLKRLTITQTPVRSVDGSNDDERVALEASSSVSYDVQRFVKALQRQPLVEVKVLSTETAATDSGSRKIYGVEATY